MREFLETISAKLKSRVFSYVDLHRCAYVCFEVFMEDAAVQDAKNVFFKKYYIMA